MARADIATPPIPSIVEFLRMGCLLTNASAPMRPPLCKTLDNDYQDIFEEYEGDRSTSAPWCIPYYRFLAATFGTFGLRGNARSAAYESLYHTFTIERSNESSRLEDQILSAIGKS